MFVFYSYAVSITNSFLRCLLIFSFRDYSYFWVPVVGPHIGAVIGAWGYRLLIEQHWPIDSYDFHGPTEIKSNGEFKKKDDLPFVDKKSEY